MASGHTQEAMPHDQIADTFINTCPDAVHLEGWPDVMESKSTIYMRSIINTDALQEDITDLADIVRNRSALECEYKPMIQSPREIRKSFNNMTIQKNIYFFVLLAAGCRKMDEPFFQVYLIPCQTKNL